ncbi:UPF0182 family protein [Aeromicrobium sp. CnD17-E]|uniref:UPF0182 family membrane protein n=1 Tax=Aeromicrobium sp. CnD17-E TaxID=2954487 RepID=UPI0020980D53|nr:UPF0182 family protein [Aeromicrobium sp. CnD17-E]MCO7240321.1 UPF0182 family protein [Aeromicrobium sp. CnD17-E]
MSDIFGTPRPRPEPTPGGVDKRRKVLVPTLVTLAALLFLGSIFTSVWTDRLWFRSVDYSNVFTTVIVNRVGLFAVLGLLFGLVVAANAWLAHRLQPDTLPMRRDDPAFRYRQALSPVKRPALIVLAVVLTVFAGSVASSRWETFQLWRHGTSFGEQDPQFNKDIGFFVFDLPWFNFLSSFLFALVVVAVLVSVFVHYVFGGIRFAGRGPRFTRAAQVHLAVLVGFGVLLRAFGYWLDRYNLAVNGSGLFTGIGFTDAKARIPAANILIGVALVCAVLFFASVFVKSWVLPGVGLGLLLLTSVLIGGVWPYVMQSFQVRPSEPDKEGPYIARNIEATREAYDVADVETEDYTANTTLTPQELNASAESRVSTRLLDPTLISPAFQQLQQVRGYYTVPQTLDVDRYKLGDDDIPQDVIIAARELDLGGLQDSQRNWANDHTVYTHGYGIIAARGNQRGEQGEPVWVEKDIPPVGEIETEVPPRIYFGESSPSYSIVGRPEGAAPIEVDIPRGGGSGNDGAESATQNTYDGEGGVPIGSLFHKVLYAFKFAEPNIVLSNRVNENSKILYDRHPRDRVEKVAPWLTVDGDTYPAVVDGRVVWIVDGYTTSNSYPYSERRSLRQATDDTLTQGSSQAALPTDNVNYMRNSVKAVVDAYDGSVKLYQWDTQDPVLKTWMKVFPGVVEPRSEIDQSLLEHLRYPVDLFKVQRNVLERYHVTDAQTFYEDGERWRVPEDPATPSGRTATQQPPYYLTTARPGQEDPAFSLTSVYLPNSRQNLAAFMSVNSEASSEDYGKLQILQLPSDTQVPGPSQIANQFSSDRGVTQALLQFRQSDAQVLNGNLLTLPVGDALLYVQPVYIRRQANEGTYPVLQFVAASFGEEVGFGQTLDEALRVALGLAEGSVPDPDEESSGGDTGGSGDGGAKTTQEYLRDASAAYSAAQKALEAGDLAEYQRRINQMNAAVENAQDALGQSDQSGGQ